MKKVSKFEFLINSPEFKIFSRPTNSTIEKGFEKMAKLTTEQILARTSEALVLEDKDLKPDVIKDSNGKIFAFKMFYKKVYPLLD